MSVKNYGIQDAVHMRARKEGVVGPWYAHPGVKGWAKRCLNKVERETTKTNLRKEVDSLELERKVTKRMHPRIVLPELFQRLQARFEGKTEIRVKGKRGVSFSKGEAFTSPSDFHLRQMGFADYTSAKGNFGEYAEAIWETKIAA